jgi:uncharacterized SAM-binding protein YcdF (DUF218 family)
MARAVALFLGAFVLLNQLGEVLRDGFDESIVLLDLPHGVFGFLAAALVAGYGLRPPMGRPRRIATTAAAAFLLVFATADSVGFYTVLDRGGLTTALPVPLSLLVALGFGLVLFSVAGPTPGRPWRFFPTLLAAGGLALAFPLLLVAFFGASDYRRPADAAVVFGARAYADGRPSTALADRVRTAVGLFRAGDVPCLVFSGGPGDGSVHETEAMRGLARSMGVPEGAILVDEDGLSTADTVRNLARICRARGFSTVLAVSHSFHLPRIKMAARREGIRVLTVPAVESRRLHGLPWLLLREVAAWWAYWTLAAH